MKNVLGWVKTNWLIVTCCVVMVCALLAGYIGSSMWSKSQRTAFQTKVQQAMQQVQGARVNYAIPTLTPDEARVSESGPPNAVKTQWFEERIRARIEQANALVSAAEDFNKGRNQAGSNRIEHVPLISGIFPQPANERVGETLRLDFRDRVIGGGGRPSAIAAMLERFGAGPAADLRRVEAVLSDMRDRENEAVRTETGAEPTDQQKERIAAMLTERRVQEYQRASRDISMYATPGVFRMTFIPDNARPSLQDCFAWQWDFWVASDLMAALALCNTDADGLRTDVARSLVKRVERIQIEPIDLSPPSLEEMGMMTEEPQALQTITGRSPKNEDYDIRYATLTLIVASERMPELFDALARTNFMSVTEFRFEQVDAWSELRLGHYYGSDNVVRVVMKVETVWLRSWTGPLMPPSVREALGVVLPEPEPAM